MVLFIVFFGSLIIKDSPLNAVQMLWVNLIMDTLGALALATEVPDDDILTRQPTKKGETIMTNVMWRNVFGHAIYQIVVILLLVFYAPGTLINDYWVRCYEFQDGQCVVYNAFYTRELYQTPEQISWWKNLNLTRSQFEESDIKDMICQKFRESALVDDSYECTPEVYNDPANYYSPNEF